MPKPRKKTAFVPSVVFGTVVLGVVPACAVSCGGATSTAPGGDAAADSPRDAFSVADVGFPGVAAVGFCAFCDAGPGDATDAANAKDAAGGGDAADAARDAGFPGVAAVAFCRFCDAGDAGQG